MLNVFMMRTQELGLHIASAMEPWGLVFRFDGILTNGDYELQGEKVLFELPVLWVQVLSLDTQPP